MSPGSQQPGMAYRPDIDGLRAVAVLGVLLFHASPGLLPGGFAGVDVFFVISGYLITALLLQDCAAGRFSIARFYVRRVRRIFPALLLVLGSVWALGFALMMPGEFRELGRSMVASAYFGNNFLLVAQAGYFDSSAELKPLLHLWSLAVEEQFYIVWPWLLFLIWRTHSGSRFFTLGLTVASLIWCVMQTPLHRVEAFYLPHYRAWELLAGALVALQADYPHRSLRRVSGRIFQWAGLAMIAGTYLLIDGQMNFPGWIALVPVAGAVLVLLAGLRGDLSASFLACRPLVAIGLISYPLYLWHWPLFAYGRILFGELSLFVAVFLALLATLLAYLTYRFIEQPVRRGLPTRPLIAGALLLFLALGGLGDLTRHAQGFPQRVPGEAWRQLDWAADQVASASCRQQFFPQGDYCLWSRQQAPEYALIGDSHANHFFPGLAERLAAEGGSLLQIQGPVKPLSEENWRNVTDLAGLQSVKIVFVAYHHGRQHQADNPFGDILEKMLGILLNRGKTVVLIRDNPEFDFDPRLCTKRPVLAQKLVGDGGSMRACLAETDTLRRKRAGYDAYLSVLSGKYPDLRFLDAFSALCQDDQCMVSQGDILLYRDSHHLSLDGSRFLFTRISDLVPAR